METKELIAKLEAYIELGHKFKTYELLKTAVRKICYMRSSVSVTRHWWRMPRAQDRTSAISASITART